MTKQLKGDLLFMISFVINFTKFTLKVYYLENIPHFVRVSFHFIFFSNNDY